MFLTLCCFFIAAAELIALWAQIKVMNLNLNSSTQRRHLVRRCVIRLKHNAAGDDYHWCLKNNFQQV